MNTYLIAMNESIEFPLVISAGNEQEALNTYVDVISVDENYFNEDGNFYEPFSKNCDDDVLRESYEKFIKVDANEVGIEEYDKLCEKFEFLILEDVKCNYFKNRPDFAEIYLNYYHGKKMYNEKGCIKFPIEMIDFIWRKLLKSNRYTQFLCINLSELDQYAFKNRTNIALPTKFKQLQESWGYYKYEVE